MRFTKAIKKATRYSIVAARKHLGALFAYFGIPWSPPPPQSTVTSRFGMQIEGWPAQGEKRREGLFPAPTAGFAWKKASRQGLFPL
jgi:hypothetical protein